MLETIKYNIDELLETIKKLKDNETIYGIDQILQENKYIKPITQKYMQENEIEKTIKTHLKIVKTLKEQHIKLTEDQKEKEKAYLDYIKEIETTLKNINKLIENLLKHNTYIDAETIEILKIEDTKELLEIIKYNQQINLKKQGLLIKQEEKKPKQPTTKIEETLVIKTNTHQIQKQETLTQDTINEYLIKKYNITINSKNTPIEQKQMIEILEQKPFSIEDAVLFKKILELSNLKTLLLIKENLIEQNIVFKEISHLEKILFEDMNDMNNITLYSALLIINNNTLTKEEKIEILKDDKKRITCFLNIIVFSTYYKNKYKLPKEAYEDIISIEKIDQIIEVGAPFSIDQISLLYLKHIKINKKDSMEKYLKQTLYPYLYIIFYSNIISRKNFYVEKLDEVATKKVEQHILEEIITEKRCKIPILCSTPTLKNLLSRNKILLLEKETSTASIEHLIDTQLQIENKKSMPYYKINNKYINYLEQKYGKKHEEKYIIPITTNGQEYNIIISKYKVVRLINQHIYREDIITKELLIQCIVYNLIITEDLLQALIKKLEKNLTEIDKKNQKTKKYQ